MRVGCPEEIKNHEYRVGLTPESARELVIHGHEVWIESGAGLGIGRIGGMAVEAMSRQPEVAGGIQTGMIIAAALIEGATFFALILIGFLM